MIDFTSVYQEMRKDLDHVVTMMLKLFHDLHMRFHWSSIHAIGLLSIELSLDLQQYQRVLLSIVGAMDDSKEFELFNRGNTKVSS